MNVNSPKYYSNREISWLDFNTRVLYEATKNDVPIAEKLKFLAIYSSNLDEFYMVRVASLRKQFLVNYNSLDNKTGWTNEKQLTEIGKKVSGMIDDASDIYQSVVNELSKSNIHLTSISQLDDDGYTHFKELYADLVYPTLTPMTMDVHRPFPTIQNLNLNVAFHLYNNHTSEYTLGIVSLPNSLPRFFKYKKGASVYIILIEDVIKTFSEDLFPGFESSSKTVFRVTRDADFSLDEDELEDVESLILMLQNELKHRYNKDAVRLEIDIKTDEYLKTLLMEQLKVDPNHLYSTPYPMDLKFFFPFSSINELKKKEYTFENFMPQLPRVLENYDNMFDQILEKDLFLHHPYESFDPVIKLLEQSSVDPNVLAIKQTIYRATSNSPILNALIKARENGKDVTVLFEVKARFDEENNLEWANKLEKVGCQVIYGVAKFKTHSKIMMIVRRRGNKIERVVHYGTGNYNEKTAKLYSDFGYLTSKKEYVEDATEFFNYLTTYGEMPKFNKILMSPYGIKNKFMKLIDKEINYHNEYGNGYIFMKFNSLTDKELIMKLLEAADTGMQIELVVRGICCVVPHKNMTIRSIVGRFLEHTRMYHFHQNGKDLIYISSADLMTRNMIRRIEIACPIENEEIKKRIMRIEKTYLKDTHKASVKQPDGSYVLNKGKELLDSQLFFFKEAYTHSMTNELIKPKKKTIKKYIRELFKEGK